MKLVIVVLCLAIFERAVSDELPKYFKRCISKDTACLTKAIQDLIPKLGNGIKELDIPKLDPLRIPKLTVGGGKIVQLVQNYQNVDVIGLGKSTLSDLSLDIDKGKISLQIYTPKLEFSGTYSVKGKILVLDVYGKGSNKINLKNIKIKIEVDVQKYEKNGETHLKMTKATVDMYPESVHYQFDNLFDGNKQLGDNINNVLNDNWKEIFEELKGEYMQAIADTVMNLSNDLFEKVPIKNIFLD